MRSVSMRRTRPSLTTSLDLPQGPELASAEHRAAVHPRRPLRVDAYQSPRGLEPLEELVDVRRLGGGLGIEREPLHDRADLLQGLKVPAIVEPRLAGPDPANSVRLHAVLKQPGARVRCRLAGSEHCVGAARLRGRRQVVDRDEPYAGGHVERDRMGCWDRPLQVPGVHDAAPYGDIAQLSGAQVPNPLTVAGGAEMLVAGQYADPACLRESPSGLSEVLENLHASCPLIVPRVLADLVDAVLAERQRVHAVIRGGSVQANERIHIRPMTARGLSTVYHGYVDVPLGRQCVGEREAARAGPYDQ